MHTAQHERPLGDLFKELSRETSVLVRNEVKLAKAEVAETASRASGDVKMIVLGGAVANAGLIACAGAASVGLAEVLPLWAAALIVGVVLLAIGYAFVQKAMGDLKHVDPTPRTTLRTLEEDKQWLRRQMT